MRITELTTVNCGNGMPRLPQKRRDQAPPASTTASQAMRPFSVTTPETRPAEVSRPRTAQCGEDLRALPPGAVGDGGRGHEGLGAAIVLAVKSAPFHWRVEPGWSSSASSPETMRVARLKGRAFCSCHFSRAASSSSVSQR